MAKCIIFFVKDNGTGAVGSVKKWEVFQVRRIKSLQFLSLSFESLNYFIKFLQNVLRRHVLVKRGHVPIQKYPKCIRILPHFLIEIKFYFFVRVQDSCLSVSVTSLWWQVGVGVRLSEMFAMIHRERERERKWRIERKKIEFRMFETNNEDEVS